MNIQGLEELIARVRSGVVHLIIHKGKERLGSGTGFFVSQKLITTSLIALEVPADARLAVRFHDTPPAHADHSFSSEQIEQAVCAASGTGSNDYAVLNLPDLLEQNPYQFKFADSEAKIGQSVAILGYPLDHWCLTCHSGIVSSIYPRAEMTMLQFQASAEPSNVGGPLFDGNGDVLGIAAHEATPLTSALDNLLQSFDKAITVLSGARFFAGASQAMIAIQQEMKEVARQIHRSSNVGVGLAIACDKIKNESIWSSGSSPAS